MTRIGRVRKGEACVERFYAGDHFRNLVPGNRSVKVREGVNNVTHRMSLELNAACCSSGVMNSFANVGIPENALRTKLRCLKSQAISTQMKTDFHGRNNLPAEIIPPDCIANDA